MSPIFYIKDDNEIEMISTIDEVKDDILIHHISEDGIVIQPLADLQKNNLIAWVIINGFNMFDSDHLIVVNRGFILTKKILEVAEFAFNAEKMTNVGMISLIGRRDFGGILYTKVDYVDLNCFMVSKALGKKIREEFANRIFNENEISFDELLKDFSNFELTSLN